MQPYPDNSSSDSHAACMGAGRQHVYRCGNLTYTKMGLAVLFAWMLWGDFCFTLMETAVPR